MKLGNTVETTQQGNFGKMVGKLGASLTLVGLLSGIANSKSDIQFSHDPKKKVQFSYDPEK